METIEKIHPFENSGMGIGPFEYVGFIELPSSSFGSHNPSAYNTLLAQAHTEASDYGVTLGSCNHCGTGLRHHCVIEDSRGKTFVVGNVCVQKTGDQYLGNKTKIAASKMAKIVRERNKKMKEEIWMASPSRENPELTNEQLIEVKRQQRVARWKEQERIARENYEITFRKSLETWGFYIDKVWGTTDLEELEKIFKDYYGGFAVDVTRLMMEGQSLSWKQWDICADIYAKEHGRSNSRAYSDAYDEYTKKVAHLRE